MTPTGTDLSTALAALGIEDSDTNREQLRVMAEALEIFQERNSTRRDLWRRYGPEDSAKHCRSKADRVHMPFDHSLLREGAAIPLAEVEDDALDLVNYAVFFIRNTRNPLPASEIIHE